MLTKHLQRRNIEMQFQKNQVFQRKEMYSYVGKMIRISLDLLTYIQVRKECLYSFKKIIKSIDLLLGNTLSSLREHVVSEGIAVSSPYVFLFKKAPVTSFQEKKKSIQDCLNFEDGTPTVFLRKEVSNQ